jgi:hypothetical protein
MKSQGHSTGSQSEPVTFVLNLVTPVPSLGKLHMRENDRTIRANRPHGAHPHRAQSITGRGRASTLTA